MSVMDERTIWLVAVEALWLLHIEAGEGRFEQSKRIFFKALKNKKLIIILKQTWKMMKFL